MQDRSFSSLGAPGASGGNNAAASIPLSVYRQQTAEMEQLKANLASIQGENEHLRHQNKELIAAIEKFVASAVELGESTSTMPISTPSPNPITAPLPQTPPTLPPGSEQAFAESLETTPNPLPELGAMGAMGALMGQSPADPSAPSAVTVDSNQPSVLESNRWISLLGIVVIAAIAFGISFALVGVFRPNRDATPTDPATPDATVDDTTIDTVPVPPPPAEAPAAPPAEAPAAAPAQ